MKITKLRQFNKEISKYSIQGMHFFDRYMVQLFNHGHCAVYDLNSDSAEPLAYFKLASCSKENHANCCNFGIRHYKDNPIPLLYVVDGYSGEVMKCSVENIYCRDGVWGSEKVQEFNLDQSGFEAKGYIPFWGWPCWIVSDIEDVMYLHGARFRTNGSMDDVRNQNRYIICKFRLPSVEEGDKIFTADDVIDYFDTEYDVNFTQGGTVSGKYLIYCFGTGREGRPSAIRIWDLEAHKLMAPVDVSEITEEIEDCVVRDGKLIFNTQEFNLYSVDMKDIVRER